MQIDPGYCYICGKNPTDTHHCLHGAGRRQLAEEDGLYVKLCRGCHDRIHFGDGHKIDLFLEQEAQEVYEKKHTRQDFMDRYGKNYMEG